MDPVRCISWKQWKCHWKLKKSVLAAVTGIILVVSDIISSSSACTFPAIYNFGDSNSDTGANSATFGRVTYPCGETYFGKPSGRLCDGRLMIDFIAEKLRLPFLNAYLDSFHPNFLHGANFAVSGATIQPADGKLLDAGFNPLSLNIQLQQFQQFKVRTTELYNQETRNILPKPEDFSRALYTLDCGQNDLHYFLESMTDEQVKASIPIIINQFALAVEKLYQEGARMFWVHNTGPIGCLPHMVNKYPPKPDNDDQNGCIKPFNVVAQEFNNQLKERVSLQRTQLHGAVFVHVDIYSAKYSLISEAKKYGFVSPTEQCNGDFKGRASCNDPSKYISWDGIHYTEAANHWIADRIMDGSYSDPPYSISEACGNLSLVMSSNMLTRLNMLGTEIIDVEGEKAFATTLLLMYVL